MLESPSLKLLGVSSLHPLPSVCPALGAARMPPGTSEGKGGCWRAPKCEYSARLAAVVAASSAAVKP